LSPKAVHSWVTDVSLMTKRLKRRCGSGWDNSQKTSMLRVSAHWYSDGTSVSMLMEAMPRNNCFRRFEYHMFYVLYPFVTCLLTVPSTFQRMPTLWDHLMKTISIISAINNLRHRTNVIWTCVNRDESQIHRF
jgi:hypothetical protein